MRIAVRRNQIEESEVSFLAVILSILILIVVAFYTFLYGTARVIPASSAKTPPAIDQSVVIVEGSV
jgi:hypothetical protein